MGSRFIRCASAQSSESSFVFILTIHHALYDGWCLPQILNDVIKNCQGAATVDREPYSRYIAYISSQSESLSVEFWKNYLKNCAPTLYPNARNPGKKVKCMQTVSQSISANISIFRLRANVSPGTLLKACWGLVLGKHSGSDDVLFGFVNCGREIPLENIDSIMGPCINTLPTRISWSASKPLQELLTNIQKDNIEQCRHGYLGLTRIFKMLPLLRGSSMFQTILNYINFDITEMDDTYDDKIVFKEKEEIGGLTMNFPIIVRVHNSRDGFLVEMEFDSGIICEDEAHWVIRHFCNTIQFICNSEVAAVQDVVMTDENEQEVLLDGVASKEKNLKGDSYHFLHETFEKQARQTPQWIAIEEENGTLLTYEEVNCKANQLAYFLQSQRFCESKKIIPLCFNKSSSMIISALAVMKLGCAFVALDPESPIARNMEVIKAVKSTVVLTTDQLISIWNEHKRFISHISRFRKNSTFTH